MNRGLLVHGGSLMKKYFAIALGAFLIALGAAHFAEPAGLVTGGAAGIAIIVERIAEVPLFITTLFVNIPLFAAAGRKMGFKFLSSSLLASALYTVFLGVLENVPHLIIDDILVSAAVSGVLTGAGLGITIKSGATTGGTDMLAMLIKNYKPHIKPSTVINITDGAIILAGAALLGAERSFYAILSVAVSTFVMTRILEGGSAAKGVMIITDKDREIAKSINSELERGATFIPVRGAYKNESGTAVFTAVSERQLPYLIETVKRKDPAAFAVISDIRGVLGDF